MGGLQGFNPKALNPKPLKLREGIQDPSYLSPQAPAHGRSPERQACNKVDMSDSLNCLKGGY